MQEPQSYKRLMAYACPSIPRRIWGNNCSACGEVWLLACRFAACSLGRLPLPPRGSVTLSHSEVCSLLPFCASLPRCILRYELTASAHMRGSLLLELLFFLLPTKFPPLASDVCGWLGVHQPCLGIYAAPPTSVTLHLNPRAFIAVD